MHQNSKHVNVNQIQHRDEKINEYTTARPNALNTVCHIATWEESDTTVMILSFRTDRPWQTVQTQIRLLLEEQSDLGLHCLPFRMHHLDSLFYGRAT